MPSSGRTDGTALPDKVEQEHIWRIVLKNGQMFRGHIIEQSDNQIRIDLFGAGEMTLELDQVQSITVDKTVEINEKGEIYKRDPNRTRYLYSPSAMPLGKGEKYFSQKMLFFSSYAQGVTDNISFLVGSMIPAIFWGGYNFITAVKVADTFSEDGLHLATGFEAFHLTDGNDGGTAGFIFGSATIGTHLKHWTISVGKPFISDPESSDLGPVIATLSGNLRIGRKTSLISENWFVDGEVINSFAVRLMGENLAVDLGGIVPMGEPDMMIPWLDFTYNTF